MDVTLTLGPDDAPVTVEISDDSQYVPEILSDWLRRGADTALRLYRDLHPAEKETA